MSWSASVRIPSGTDKNQAYEMIDALEVPMQTYSDPGQPAQVLTTKDAAKALLRDMKERVGKDFLVSLSGHAGRDESSYDTLGCTVSHVVPSPA